MNFHLSFPIDELEHKVDYNDKLLFVGSCFAENIGKTLEDFKFDVMINPNGIIYNPVSIASSICNIIDKKLYTESDLFYANACWNSWKHHSRFSDPDKLNCLKGINDGVSKAHQYLKQAKWLFITLGSSFIYKNISTGETVANCHKIPQKKFSKALLTSNEIVTECGDLINRINNFNKDINIIFTVSPVRYVRDGVIENNLSKARLIDATHSIIKEHSNCFYFPAYELVNDDLRDYRFFESDLIHPNQQAIDYVFEKLMAATFSDDTKALFEKVKDIVSAKKHRPFNENSAAHVKFKEAYLKKCQQLQKEFAQIDLTAETEYFQS